MKVAHFVPIIASKPGFESNVSGHVQVPMHSLRLLRDAGHDVHLITNPLTEDRPVWPNVLPDGIGMHFVDDGRRRSPVVDGVTEPTHGIHPGRLLRQMGQIKRIAREQQFDVLHFFGFARTAHLAVILRRGGLKTPMVMTLFNGDRSRGILSRIGRRAWTRVMPMVTATRYVASMCADQGVETTVIRHGPVRDLRGELNGHVAEPTDRVLFWRDASFENGADVCIRAYDALAAKHRDVQMEFAVRPHWSEVEGLEALAARHPNVHIHRFPYPPGVTLPGLVLGSLCVVMPFRAQSVQPQLVIVESMAGGVPVVASDLCSTNELIEHGRTGMLVPVGDAEATTAALDEMLRDRAATRAMGERGRRLRARRLKRERGSDPCGCLTS
jgi:glycosyltransferase involved in cell wall biosynthesis